MCLIQEYDDMTSVIFYCRGCESRKKDIKNDILLYRNYIMQLTDQKIIPFPPT